MEIPKKTTNITDVQADAFHNQCINRLQHCLQKSFNVKRLMYAIEEMGCKLPPEFFSCEPCFSNNVSGGFITGNSNSRDYQPGIILCEDNRVHRQEFSTTMVHELIHAYDFCRAKVDASNCLHHACTEIRASNLSEECSYSAEIMRGHNIIGNGQRDCVRRRAELSVSMNPSCKNIAKEAVEQVFERCFSDMKPFERPMDRIK